MPRNGSGTYQLPSTSFNPAVPATDIEAAAWNTTGADLAAALTGSLAKDGQTVPTANLPMGGFKHTGVGNGTARTQYPSIAQIQDGALIFAAAGSSVTSYVINLSPAVTAYVDGQEFNFKAVLGNASAVTLAVNSASAFSIVKNFDEPLVSGDIVAGQIVSVRWDAANSRFQMMSPSAATQTGVGNGIGHLTASANMAVGFDGSGIAAKFAATPFARTVWDDATAASARSTMAAAILGAVEGINTQTGLAYKLALTDIGKIVEMNRASANTVTIPSNASVAFATNSTLDIVQYGAGQTTIAPGSGVTIRSAAGLKIAAQYGGASIYKRGTDEWVVVGRTTT